MTVRLDYSEGPPPPSDMEKLGRRAQAWLLERENNHLSPIGPNVICRPHTPQEAEARRKRLAKFDKPGKTTGAYQESWERKNYTRAKEKKI